MQTTSYGLVLFSRIPEWSSLEVTTDPKLKGVGPYNNRVLTLKFTLHATVNQAALTKALVMMVSCNVG